MTASTVRSIAWDIPLMQEDDNVCPATESIDFATWLSHQNPKDGNDSERLNTLARFVWHVSWMLSPSKHLHKGAGQHRIAAAYKDPRIFEEFQRWMNALTWEDGRHLYTRNMYHFNSPLARPWLLQCMQLNPACRIGFQLANALECDDKLDLYHKNNDDADLRDSAKETLLTLKQLGVPIDDQTLPQATYAGVLEALALEYPDLSLRPQQHLFEALYDPKQWSEHDLNSRQGQLYFRDALFKHLMAHCRPLNPDVKAQPPLALPENWMDTP